MPASLTEVVALAAAWCLGRQVCQRWRAVCATMQAVTIDLSWARIGPHWRGSRSNPLTDAGLAAILGRFHSVHTVRLESCNQVSDMCLTRQGGSDLSPTL